MLNTFRYLRSARLSTFLVGGVLVGLCAAPVAAVPSLECALDDGLVAETSSAQRKSLQVEQAGYLLVEVQGSGEQAAWFDLAQDCGQTPTARLVEYGFDRGILWVEPGPLDLRYGAVETGSHPSLSLSVQWMDRFGTKDDDEGDDTETGTAEIVPKRGFTGWPWPDKDDDEGDDTETGTAEIVPNQGFTGEDFWRGCLDGAEPFDDFAFCASPLVSHRPVVGELEAKGLGDRDYYALTLERTGRVQLSLQGHSELVTTLLRTDGRPLRHLSLRGEASKALHVLDATLPAGEYLVRVEGSGNAVGPYRLEWR